MKKQKKGRIFPLAVLCGISLAVMVLALAVGNREERAAFVPPPFDESAVAGIPAVPDGLGWGELDAQIFKASLCGVIASNEGTADVWLTNPEGNAVWLKLRMLDENGAILGETGLIKPGQYVKAVALSRVPEPGTDIVLKLMAYEPDTYYSAGSVSLNTTIS